MNNVTFAQLWKFIMTVIQPKLVMAGLDSTQIDDNFDLLSSGLLDSFEFLDLVMAMEVDYGLSVDLSKLNPDSFTTIGGLIDEVLNQKVG